LSIPLKLKGPRTATKDAEFVVTVINGSDYSAVKGATVQVKSVEATTDEYGAAKLKLAATGEYIVTAKRGTDVPSNVLKLNVTG
jgi:hypothetical protein